MLDSQLQLAGLMRYSLWPPYRAVETGCSCMDRFRNLVLRLGGVQSDVKSDERGIGAT